METKTQSASLTLVRSIAIGVLVSMLFFYGVHLFGKWEIENFRPDSETTGTILLHNTCAVFGNTHTLRPNTDISAMSNGIDGTKLSASFMNFFDGHVPGMVILALLIGGVFFVIRNTIKKNRKQGPAL